MIYIKDRIKIIVALTILSFALGGVYIVSADDTEDEFTPDPVVFTEEGSIVIDAEDVANNEDKEKAEEDELTPEEEELKKELEEEQRKKQRLINNYVSDFSSLKMTERDVTKEIEKNQKLYDSLHDRLTSLYKQVKEIDRSMKSTERDIEDLEDEIDDLRDDMDALEEDIAEKKKEIIVQEDAINKYVNALYLQSQQGTLDMLLAGESFGDVVEEVEVMNILEEQGELMFAHLNELKRELEDDLEKVDAVEEKLSGKRNEKKDEIALLREQRESKDELITLTRGKQEEYQKMIQIAKIEQKSINRDLERIKEDLELLEADQRARNIELTFLEFGDKLGKVSEDGLAWPVDPARGITAYFKDSSYKATLGVEHYGLDVRASMQTPIMAAADGYVYKAKDAGYGYSYIVLVHSKEIATVYGHIYDFNVEEGELVEQGQIIGYSGGMPGTKGAGILTTGPHLHFEVRVDGKAVDPLDFLP